MEFRTERLWLREYLEDDFEAMLAYESDPLVVQYVCYGPFSREECWEQLRWHIDHQMAKPRTYYHMGMVLLETNELIGWCGLEMVSRENREAELAYALNRDYWGSGFMTEAARGMIKTGFEELDLHRIFATCDPENSGSIRVLEKVGMRYEGCLKAQKWCRGRLRDTAVYGLLENEF